MKWVLSMSLVILSLCPRGVVPQSSPITERSDSLSIRFVDTDLKIATQMLARYLEKPVFFSGGAGTQVSFETPRPVPRADVFRLLVGLLDENGYEIVDDTSARLYRVRARRPAQATPTTNTKQAQADSGVVKLVALPLKHARASDVAATIEALYGSVAGPAVTGVGASGTLAEQLRGNLLPAVGAEADPSPERLGRSGGAIIVVTDTRTNTLLVRATPGDVELIRALVETVDQRPLQVLIEVLVAEVRRDRSIGIGVEAELGTTALGSRGVSAEGALGEAGLGDFALRVMGIGGLDLTGTLRLAAGRGSVRILTRPVVLATNNEPAEIVVGSQRPFVQVQRSLPTDGASRDQVVQYKDVGTKLMVRPTISADGTVHLEVLQEISTATAELAFNAPVIATRSVRTQLLIHDGQTAALGGLTDRQRESRNSGLPLLSSIPWIGGLFGSTRWQEIETELFIFLTPRIIRTDDDAMRLSSPLRKRMGDRP